MPQDLLLDTKRGSTKPNDFPFMVISGKLSGVTTSAATANYTAEGAIANGAPVGLRSDGKIEEIGESPVNDSAGAAQISLGVGSSELDICFDSTSGKVIYLTNDKANNTLLSYVGTVNTSNDSISLASPDTLPNGTNQHDNYYIIHDPNSNRLVAVGYGFGAGIYSWVGTLSGTSISWGAREHLGSSPPYGQYAFNSYAPKALTVDTSKNRIVYTYQDYGETSPNYVKYGYCLIGTVNPSTNTMTWGTPVAYHSTHTQHATVCFDSTNNKIVIFYNGGNPSTSSWAIVGEVHSSGNSITFGTAVQFLSTSFIFPGMVHDPANNKIVIVGEHSANSGYGWSRCGTVSGNSISWDDNFSSTLSRYWYYQSNWTQLIYCPDKERVMVNWTHSGNGNKIKSGFYDSSINNINWFGTGSGTGNYGYPIDISTDVTFGFRYLTYDSTNNRFIAGWREYSSPNYSEDVRTRIGTCGGLSSNAQTYIGLAAETFTDQETGTITIAGGTNTQQSGLTTDSIYHLQSDGTIGTSNSGLDEIGTATSATSIELIGGTGIGDDATLLYVTDDGAVYATQYDAEPTDNLLDTAVYKEYEEHTHTDNTLRSFRGWKGWGYGSGSRIRGGFLAKWARNRRRRALRIQTDAGSSKSSGVKYENISVEKGRRYLLKARVHNAHNATRKLSVQQTIDYQGGPGVNYTGTGTFTDAITGDSVYISGSMDATMYVSLPASQTIDFFWLLESTATSTTRYVTFKSESSSGTSGVVGENYSSGTDTQIADVSLTVAKWTNLYDSLIADPGGESLGSPLYSDGSKAFWAYPRTDPVGLDTSATYLNRSIFTHGYLAGGYKGSNPWRSLNKTWHATDTTFYCGERLQKAASYCDGTFSDYNGYVHAVSDSFSGSSNETASYNLHTGIQRAVDSSGYSSSGLTFPYTGQNPAAEGVSYGTAGYANHVGGWALPAAQDYNGCYSGIETQVGYSGGSSTTGGKMHFPTEVMYNITFPTSSTGQWAGGEGENYGFISIAGTRYRMAFSNDAFSSVSASWSPNGWVKILASKHGHNYSGNGGNVTLGMVKFNNDTGTDITTFNKLSSTGEENYEMGQDWGYMLGNFNGQQNNMTWKYTYSTDAQTAMGFSTQPKGHFGQSSGACSSAAATVTVNQQQ